jgi:putative serine protease PepD
VIDAAGGYVLTNNHVVSGAMEIQVALADGRLLAAELVGADPTTDLAVIRLLNPPTGLGQAVIGDSEAVMVGQPVMAVGNPLGYDNSVTTGTVSAVHRPVTTSAAGSVSEMVVTNAIQIDAAINPGNSGGPLFNAAGQVIGINSSIATLSGGWAQESGSIGIGFAIPSNLADMIARQLIETGRAVHPYLGVTLQDGTAQADGVKRRGAAVAQVTPGSPAEAAGLRSGDLIVAIDGEPTVSTTSLTAWVRSHAVGDEVRLSLIRDGAQLDLPATLAVYPEASGASGTPSGRGGGYRSDGGSNPGG